MTVLCIGSVNCRGLSEEVKRRDVFDRYRKKYDITILTDTHCEKSKESKWQHEWGYKAYFSSYTSHSRGVAILLNNTFKFTIHKEINDEHGNFLILDITIQEYRITLVALYGPNNDSPEFFEKISTLILEIQNSSVIMVGDWNVVQNYELDTLNYLSKNNLKSHDRIFELKQSLDLIDIWREKNPDARRYTWRGPQKKQSRLDYFLISSDIVSLVQKTDIDISYRSDHSPVYLTLQFYNQKRGKGTWKFNNSLLHDKEYVSQIKECIKETVNQYTTYNTDGTEEISVNPHIFWELLKCLIRGKTISYSAYQKKKTQKEECELEQQLYLLQRNFQIAPSMDLEQEIKNCEENLIAFREKKVNGIMARAKAKWEAEGEKCTHYFCNLEKRHFQDKIIPKLLGENGEEYLDQFEILHQQKSFYEKLYTSSKPIMEVEHENLFCDPNNPFINKLSDEDKMLIEGELGQGECLAALKNMKNGKSPGLDGFTVEFYKFFWLDLSTFLINSYNHSYEQGHFSISQRQGLITCIPKEGKSKFLLKNWRPITLLNVDTKIASATLANRIKPVLKNIISETQQGFIKGRYIGECTRLIFDLIERTEVDNIPGLLLLLDFEKAFDTLEWSFIERTLSFLGFGPSLCKWVKVLYSDIQSCIAYNGHCSEFFAINRGVRQGDPLSPYLFILALELMSAALKNDPRVNGIKINNSEYLLSQYADDSSLLLDDDQVSLERALDILEKYSECAGLRANLDKTEAIWIGSKKYSKETLLPGKNLQWNQSGNFKLLGIKFELFEENKTLLNFVEKIQKVKTLLDAWNYRNLTYLGKITVIKSLALPILIQCLTVLPNPPKTLLNQLQHTFFLFVWNGKPDKIKRNVSINLLENGGLKIPHLESFCYSLKMTWIHKLLDPFNMSPWKTLLVDEYNKFGGDKIWLLSPSALKKISPHFNCFWRDIFLNWSILVKESLETNQDILSQSIWFNKYLKINNDTVFYKKWCQAGVFFINDLINENKSFFSLQEFQEKYCLNVNYLQYYSILHMIPKNWKDILQNSERLSDISCDNFCHVKNHKKSCQFFYKQFLSNYSEQPIRQQRKWCVDLNVEIDDWEAIYMVPFHCTKNNKYVVFQYKILNRFLCTNSLLYKCGLKETHLCSFCGETKETILHIFWECSVSRTLWLELTSALQNRCSVVLPVSSKNIILGSIDSTKLINVIFIVIKYYIYSCKLSDSHPSIDGAINKLKNCYKIEKLSASFYRSPATQNKIDEKWYGLNNILEE